ncbi:YcaO-like family protein [Natronolimnobius baerhuensis]|uniref:Bacteriocin biosynthesis protein SagD n=1 Tax=Natronolimnobius baerhuensis TaxID=253108 RepID=A0A202E7D8_9EURY|nr:YcaO-like family protein [Natronolimnobius baerhuensis]OVE84182.1 bacteriocin biosynthesis protein SagD [Natronolimnobius baerhuensis]
MDVHLVGDDPVYETVATALEDVDIGVVDAEPAELTDARFGVVSDVAGSETFLRANEAARAGGTPWVAVEIGGVGGHPLPGVDAAISGFAAGAGAGCFECLRTRVGSTTDETAAKPSADRSTARLAGALAGRECVRVFEGADDSIIGRVVELPHNRRRFLPVPGCDCDGDERDRRLERDDESLALDAAVEHAEAAIDDRVGIVTSIGEIHSFPVPYYLARSANTSGFSDATAPTEAAGVADDWNAALMKGVGESLERYCAGVYRESEFVHAREGDLENPVSPADFVRPADAEYDPKSEYPWVPGENLATGEAVHLPAAAVQFPQPGPSLVPAITTGLGLGSSTVDALISGLTEVIERDATMLAWYSSFEPLELTVENERFDVLERRARSEGLSVTPLLVTQDVDVPVVAVAVHRDPAGGAVDPDSSEWPAFAAGSAAGLDATEAASSALEEALQNWMELRDIGAANAANQSGSIGEYAMFPDTVQEFVDVDGTVPAASVGPDGEVTGQDALEALLERVTDAGLTPSAARITTRDVSAIGFEAVRVVIPEAQPLFTGEPFFGERAETVPDELGFEPRLERAFHPYP